MKKRKLFLILLLALSMCITACGGDDDMEEVDKEEEAIEEVEKDKDEDKDAVIENPVNIQESEALGSGFSEEFAMKKNEIQARREEMEAKIEQIEKNSLVYDAKNNKLNKENTTKEVTVVAVGADLSVENAGVTVDKYYIEETTYGPRIHFTFTYTNKSDVDRHFNNHRLVAYQDGVRLDEAGGEDVYTQIQPGVSLQVQNAFELRNTTSDIQFKFSSPKSTSTGTSPRLESEAVVSLK